MKHVMSHAYHRMWIVSPLCMQTYHILYHSMLYVVCKHTMNNIIIYKCITKGTSKTPVQVGKSVLIGTSFCVVVR